MSNEFGVRSSESNSNPFQILFKVFKLRIPRLPKPCAAGRRTLDSELLLSFTPFQFFSQDLKVVPIGRFDQKDFPLRFLHLDHITKFQDKYLLSIQGQNNFL